MIARWWSACRHWCGRPRRWWREVQAARAYLKDPQAKRAAAIISLTRGFYYDAARWAVDKVQADHQLVSIEKNDTLKLEAIQWATAYLHERNRIRNDQWKLRLAIELAVGDVKGRFDEEW